MVSCFRRIGPDRTNEDSSSEWVVQDGKREINIVKTAQARTFWNSLAAFTAALAALAEAIALSL